MNIKETHQAAGALARWFQSQDIGMQDAAKVILVLFSRILGASLDDQTRNKLLDDVIPIIKSLAKKYQHNRGEL